MSSEQFYGGGRLKAERMEGGCAYLIEGISEDKNPWRLLYFYERWSGDEPLDSLLRVSSGHESWIATKMGERARRRGGYYPTTADYGLIDVDGSAASIVVEDLGTGGCKERVLYLRENSSDMDRYVGAISVVLFIYSLAFLFLYSVITSFFKKG